MTRAAWFHCFSGVAGDMTLGALLDAGAEVDAVIEGLRALDVPGWSLRSERTLRGGISSTRAVVEAPPQQHHRPHRDIEALILRADLPDRVRSWSQATFTALAEVEAELHGVEVADVEFHEVGALDAIVDVVGTCLALYSLDVSSVSCSPIALGLGTVNTAHGTLPNPAPASLRLLARAGAPAHGIQQGLELATPTGVALLTTLSTEFGPMPQLVVESVGHGAGGRDLPSQPNVVQVVVGRLMAPSRSFTTGQPLQLFEANVDDVTGEVLADTITKLLAAGAHDAWITPVVMKKGRPAHTVHALCDPSSADVVARCLLDETGSLGLRGSVLERWPQARTTETVMVEGFPVRVKHSAHRSKAEFDDAVRAAAALGRPVRNVLDEALRRSSGPGTE
jgi:uncharacterized protein (TIGR00299 family) protein